MCALNWRHHPEKDKEEEGERGGKKGKREAGREGMATAEIGEFFFFCFILCGGYSAFGSA